MLLKLINSTSASICQAHYGENAPHHLILSYPSSIIFSVKLLIGSADVRRQGYSLGHTTCQHSALLLSSRIRHITSHEEDGCKPKGLYVREITLK